MALSWVVWKDNERINRAANNNPSLKFGEKGQAVHLLQAALILNEIDVPSHGVGDTGVQNNNYGQETQAAVRQAETKFNLSLKDKGIAGHQVITALDRETNRFYTQHAGHFGRDLAVKDAPLASAKVERAIAALMAVRAHMGTLPNAPGLIPGPTSAASPFQVANDALRAHFRVLAPGVTGPRFCRAATRADIDQILVTYRDMAFVLRGATFAFLDGIPFNGVQTAAEANTGSERLLFGPTYRDFDGPFDKRIGDQSRCAVVLHEAMHSVDRTNRSGNDEIHISEFDPAYDSQATELSLLNPSSYAGFAAHVFLGRDPSPRFGLGPNSRQL